MIKNGTLTSEWDGGYQIVCECRIDMDSMKIIERGEYIEGDPEDDVEVLDEEYVIIDGKRYTAAPADDEAEDEYGNGIIRY